MEVYLQKLLLNQQNENSLREEREQMLRRHEKELEELNQRINEIFHQRNLIIKEFQNYLGENNLSKSAQNLLDAGLEEKKVDLTTRKLLSTSIESAFKPITTKLQQKQPQNEMENEANEKKPIVDDGKISGTETTQIPNDQTTQPIAEQPPSHPNRTLKFIPRLKTSKSMGSIMSSTRAVPESPTSIQIEQMLNKVRENILDPSTLNKCIDLLSRSKTPQTSNEISANKDEKKDQQQQQQDELQSKLEEKTEQKSQQQERKRVDDIEIVKADSITTKYQPSSPKKRMETAEERKKRIEKALFETTLRPAKNNMLSKSSTSLNELASNQNKTRTNLSLSRYVNRSKMRRQHSLSPLRFGAIKKQKSDEQTEPSSPTTTTTENNSPHEIRKYRSEQQLFFEDSSIASFEEDSMSNSQNNDYSSELDPDKLSLQPEEDFVEQLQQAIEKNEEEDDHLLAPSKVMKSQEAFKQIFFPVDIRNKPLMTKEELSKIRGKKTMVKSKSIGWNVNESSSTNDSLNVDYLSHIRRKSTSPEQKLREKELNQLANTKKFRCYQDFWENKTKEIIEKKDEFQKWQQNAANQSQLAKSSRASTKTVAVGKKPELEALKNKQWQQQPKQQQQQQQQQPQKTLQRSPGVSIDKQSISPKIVSSHQSSAAKEKTTMVGAKESKLVFKPTIGLTVNKSLNFDNNPKIEIKEPATTPTQTLKSPTSMMMATASSSSKLPTTAESIAASNSQSSTNRNEKLNVPQTPQSTDTEQKSPSPSYYSDSDSEKLIEKLRYFKQDIQRQRLRQEQMKQQQQQQNFRSQPESNSPPASKIATLTNPNVGVRPTPTKSLDLEYLTKHNRFKQQQQPIRIEKMPSQPEFTANNNRKSKIKLIRSYSRDEPDEVASCSTTILDNNNNNNKNKTLSASASASASSSSSIGSISNRYPNQRPTESTQSIQSIQPQKVATAAGGGGHGGRSTYF